MKLRVQEDGKPVYWSSVGVAGAPRLFSGVVSRAAGIIREK